MRVCILTSSFPRFKGDAMGNFIFKFAEALSKRDLVKIVTPAYVRKRLDYKIPENIELHRFYYFFPKKMQRLNDEGGIPYNFKRSFLGKIQAPLFILSFFFKSLRVSKECDIIHAQWALSAFVGMFVKKIRKIPLVVTIRGDDMNLALKNRFFKKLFRYVLKNCDYITANNEAQANKVKEMGFSNVKAIPNGIDSKLFYPKDKDKMREKLGIDKDKKIILFVGWLIKRKGVDYLIDALGKINMDDKLLYIIGEGNEKESLKRKIERSGLSEKVIFLGSIPHENIPDYMNAADLFVLPSLGEGRPNVVAEAMACGKVVIATDVGGTKEIVIDRKTGMLINSSDSEELRKTIKEIFSDDGLRRKIEKNAKRFISEKGLSWKGCVDKFLKIYKEV